MKAKLKRFSERKSNFFFFLLIFISLLTLDVSAGSKTSTQVYQEGLICFQNKQFNQAEADFLEAIKLDPKNPEPYYTLGIYYEETLSQFEKAVDAYSQHILLKGSKSLDAAQWIKRIAYLKCKFTPQSLTKVQQVLATYNAAVKDIDKKNYPAALEKLNDVLSYLPFYIDGLYARGLVYYQQKTFLLAMQDLERVNFYDPDYKDIKYYLGLTYDLFSMKSHEALGLYRTYLLKTDVPVERRKIVENLILNIEKLEEMKNRASQEYQKGNADKVELIYKDALNLRPNDIASLNNMGVLLMSKKEYVHAEQYFIQARNVNPYDASPYYNLACLYAVKQDKNTAIAYFRSALPYMSPRMKKKALEDSDLELIRVELEQILDPTQK